MADAAAIIAYGYDLTDNPRFAGGTRPSWWNTFKPLHENLLERLTQAHRAAGRPVDPVGGVFLENYGAACEERYILAVCSHTTYDTDKHALPLLQVMTVPDGAAERLAWAVEALDLDVADAAPDWHLAAWLGLF